MVKGILVVLFIVVVTVGLKTMLAAKTRRTPRKRFLCCMRAWDSVAGGSSLWAGWMCLVGKQKLERRRHVLDGCKACIGVVPDHLELDGPFLERALRPDRV